MERETDGNENSEEAQPVDSISIDLPDIIEIYDIQGEDYETMLDASEEWGMRRRLNEVNDEDMREQRQLRGLLEIDLREHQNDVVMTDPEEVDQIINNFNEIEFVTDLLSNIDEDVISNKLYKAWSSLVPHLYSWPSAATGKIDRDIDRNIDKLIIPLKILMCGDTNWQSIWNSLCMKNKRTVCGKMFKTDGIVYQCWTCSTDATTVLCSECFLHSEHRHHSYRMASSGGGGFCDCGDVESWISYPHCSIHSPDSCSMQDEHSEETKSRIKTVIRALLRNCVEILTWITFDKIPPFIDDGSQTDSERTFATVVLNDEIHSYLEVTTCLSTTLEVSRSQAYDLANLIDKEGRTTVCVGKKSRCRNMKKYIDVTMAISRLPSLMTIVMSTLLLSMQEFCIDILQKIEEWIGESEVVREAFSIAISETRGDDKSLLENILLQDDVLWKSSRALLHKILINSFIEPEWKLVFSNAYIKNYPDIIKNYLTSKDESLSFAELSVQLLTTPSLAAHLLINKDALKVIADTFFAELQTYRRDDAQISFDSLTVSRVYRLRKTFRILADIRYLLSAPPDHTDIDELSNGIISGAGSIIQILSAMQGINSYRRATLTHVQNEPEWETAFNITMRMITSIRLLLGYTKRKESLAIQFFNQIMYALKKEVSPILDWETVNLMGHSTNCIKYDILQDPVSVHYPLSRLFIGALLNCLDFADMNDLITKFGDIRPVWIFEYSLRVRVLMSQSAANLWKRNGLSLSDQLVLIATSRCRAEMADRDIMALQVGAAIFDPNEFLLHIMNRFTIVTWLREEQLYSYRGSYDKYTYKQLAFIVEEFFDLLFQILLERYHPSIGVSDWQTMLQRDMIHSLCCKNQAHNELFKDIDDPDDRKCFDNFTQTFNEILNEIAEVRKSESSRVQYILKPEYADMLNPYFSHHTRAERNHAEQVQMERRKASKLPLFLPIPLPPLFRPSFTSVVHLLDCDLMLNTIRVILLRCVEMADHPTVTEGILRKVLHFIMLTLDEERRGIVDNLHDYVKFITNPNTDLVGNIKELTYKLVERDHAIVEPLKPLLSRVVSSMHALTNYVESSNTDQSTLREADQNLLASLLFQEQKLVMAKKKHKQMAASRKAKLLAKMNRMKENFIKANQELYDQTIVQKDLSNTEDSTNVSNEAPDVKKPRSGDIVLLGNDCSDLQYPSRLQTCILCQESHDVNLPGPIMGLLCFRQLTKFLNSRCTDDVYTGIRVSTCGHTMHYKCYQKLHDPSARANWSNLLIASYGYRSFLCLDSNDMETLCPLCNNLCNVFIPFWPERNDNSTYPELNLNFEDWLQDMQSICKDTFLSDSERIERFGSESNFTYDVEEDDNSMKSLFADFDASQQRVQSYLPWDHETYHVHSFIYTVRCNIAALVAENQNIYSDISQVTLNLLDQLVILGLLHPGANTRLCRYQNMRKSLQGMFNVNNIYTESDLLQALFSTAAVLARQPMLSSNRNAFRHKAQSFLLKFALCRNYLSKKLSSESNQPSHSNSQNVVVDFQEKLFRERNLDFLRICAFFYRSVLRLPFSNGLIQSKMNSEQELAALLEYLGLEDYIMDGATTMSVVEKYLLAPLCTEYKPLEYHSVQLIDLPYDYLSLLSLAAKTTSTDSILSRSLFDDDTEESRLTFLCLHCGEVLLSDIKIRQMRSGQMGCAVTHMLKCSGYSGIFMKIKDCMIVMLQLIKGTGQPKVRGAMLSAPYVDQYGDTDDGLKRGYPLFLNPLMLQKIKQIWLRQNVPHEASKYAHSHRIAFSLYWENF